MMCLEDTWFVTAFHSTPMHDPRQIVRDDVTDSADVLWHLRERAHHEDQHPAPVVPLKRGDHLPVGAAELIDPRRALEVVP